MDFVHSCGFCEWERPARSLTLVEPRCPNCGCLLSAHRPSDEEPAGALPQATVQWTSDLVRLLLVFARIAAVVAVVAATRAGYVLGGAPIGVVFPARSSR
jgi:hypothetical protein